MVQFTITERKSIDAPYVSVNLRPSHLELRPMLFTTECVGFLTSLRTVYHYITFLLDGAYGLSSLSKN